MELFPFTGVLWEVHFATQQYRFHKKCNLSGEEAQCKFKFTAERYNMWHMPKVDLTRSVKKIAYSLGKDTFLYLSLFLPPSLALCVWVCVSPGTRALECLGLCVFISRGSTDPKHKHFLSHKFNIYTMLRIVSFGRRSHESHRAVNNSKVLLGYDCSLYTRIVKWKQSLQGINIFRTDSNSQCMSIWIAKCLHSSVLCLLPRSLWNPFAGCATYDELGCDDKHRGRLQ